MDGLLLHLLRPREFQYSSASRKFLNQSKRWSRRRSGFVSVLFSEPKIPQSSRRASAVVLLPYVSVLFSEPKIPQFSVYVFGCGIAVTFQYSSASRKFLNRKRVLQIVDAPRRFQYSSASRKFLNQNTDRNRTERTAFQYSSASRKFLNNMPGLYNALFAAGFSTLQRAENSSIWEGQPQIAETISFSTLQRAENSSIRIAPPTCPARRVSVLFSEPKIPQFNEPTEPRASQARFSTLQRAENSSIYFVYDMARRDCQFQYSSASRKFLNHHR